jgi:hypothetical protein
VSKSATELNIKIPSFLVRKPFVSAVLGLVLIVTSWQIIIGLLIGLFATRTVMSLVLYASIISMLLKFFVQVNDINFYRNDLEIKYQIFGWNYLRQAGPNSEILGAFLYKNFGGYQIKIRCGNYTGTYYYVLASNLKEIEAAWLAQEIQDWLNSR